MGGVFAKSVDRVLRHAGEEAILLNHQSITPEHILLALLEDRCVASTLLNTYGISREDVRRQIKVVVEIGNAPSPSGRLPFTRRTKTVIESALKEARLLDVRIGGIGPEFILLGLLCEREGIAAEVLNDLGLRADIVREELYKQRRTKPIERIVTSLPLTALWADAGPLEARRLRYLTSEEICEMLRAGPIRFVVANCGERLHWVAQEDCFEFWKREARARIAPPDGFHPADFPDEYCYVASEWTTDRNERVIVLEKYH